MINIIYNFTCINNAKPFHTLLILTLEPEKIPDISWSSENTSLEIGLKNPHSPSARSEIQTVHSLSIRIKSTFF